MTSDATFPSETCPCGAEQPDGERLFCDACIDRMVAEELEDDDE